MKLNIFHIPLFLPKLQKTLGNNDICPLDQFAELQYPLSADKKYTNSIVLFYVIVIKFQTVLF